MEVHWSDCAVNNGPAYPAGPCDCGMLELTENLAEQWVASGFPIRVMRAAFQRTDLLRAVPRYEHISRWKAFRYQEAGVNAGSIAVIDTWRMDVRGATGNEDLSQISILRIRNAKND